MSTAEYQAKWRAANRAHDLAYNRERRARLRELIREQDREHYANTREQHAEVARRWKLANVERIKLMDKAKLKVHRAIKKGLLTRPTHCSRCHAPGSIEAAHHDYTDPLNVTWLCRPCHRSWDAKEPKT